MLSAPRKAQPGTRSSDYTTWLIGVGLMSFSLLFSAYLGIMQERLYSEYPNQSKEVMFVAHALPLPGFLFLYSDLSSRFSEYNAATPVFGPITAMWLLLAINTFLQYTCLRSVYKLQTICSSLTVTLVITIRKFVSLIFSIVYFQNPFTTQHWLGAILVFVGALMFSEVIVVPGFDKKKKVKEDRDPKNHKS